MAIILRRPLLGLRLAALTPVRYPVNVIHPPFEPLQLETDADLIVLVVDDSFVDVAYRWADRYRRARQVCGGRWRTGYRLAALRARAL